MSDAIPGADRTNGTAVVCGVLFSGFAAAHLIDEFVWGAPAEFHLSVGTTEVLALIFVSALVGLVVGAGRGRRASYLGLAIIGVLIVIADTLKHGLEIVEPGPWRSGHVSEGLAIGLTLAALLTAGTSVMALRRRGSSKSGEGGHGRTEEQPPRSS